MKKKDEVPRLLPGPASMPAMRFAGYLPAKYGKFDERRDESDADPVDRFDSPNNRERAVPYASPPADVISQTRRTALRNRSGHLRSTRFRGPESGQRVSWPESGLS